MRHGSLFSGIGGFDLAAEWMGWENIFHCEWNEFGQQILKYYWPQAKSYNDIKKTDFTIHRGNIDILTGGFPCQPYSTSGKRKGKDDERHLWPQMLRAIREIKPAWVVGENVRGLTNWNGGLVFDEVQTELEAEGYQTVPFLLPACGVGAPHRRDRIWFIAYSNGAGTEYGLGKDREEAKTLRREETSDVFRKLYGAGIIADTDSTGLQKRISAKLGSNENQASSFTRGEFARTFTEGYWKEFPIESPICGGDDGLPSELDGIAFSKWRKESLMAYGNAIVPQVAYKIFNAIRAAGCCPL